MAINVESIARGGVRGVEHTARLAMRGVARWAMRDDNPKIADLFFGDREAWEESFANVPGGGEASLAMEDIGWMPYGMSMMEYARGDLRPLERQLIVKRARIYYVRDAFSKRAVRLHTDYCVGRGFSIKARAYKQDQTDEETQQLQDEADAFWKHPDNFVVFSTEAQSLNSDRLNVDGELFFVMQPPGPDAADDEVTRVRVLQDSLQVTKVLYNPEDDGEVWYYLRVWTVGSQQRKRLYPDWRLFVNAKEQDEFGDVVLPDVALLHDNDASAATVDPTHFVYHVKVNTIGQRGNSLLAAAMDWAKVNRQYLEDRATISRAHARFAWKRVVKGPASAVAAFGRRPASAQGVSGLPVPSPAGSTLTTNSGVDWEAMNAQDGGKNAYIESRNFRLMFYAAVGFAEHYFGDGSNGTRATSKSMEKPTEMQLMAYQMILKSLYEGLFAFNQVAKGREYDSSSVWVDAPKIAEDDTAVLITSFIELIGILPEFNVDETIILILNALGVDDPQDVLVKIREAQQEREDYQLQYAAIVAGVDLNATPDIVNDPQGTQNHINGLKAFISMLVNPNDPAHFPGPKQGAQFAPGGVGGQLKGRLLAPSKTRPADTMTQ